MILQSLIQGTDPSTGAELRDATIFQRADIIRALLAGVAALDDSKARSMRRASLPPNIGRPWSADGDAALLDAFQRGASVEAIAAEHGRTVRAIEARLMSKGMLAAQDRKTTDRLPPE